MPKPGKEGGVIVWVGLALGLGLAGAWYIFKGQPTPAKPGAAGAAAGITIKGVPSSITAGQNNVPATWSVENQSYQGSTSNLVGYTFNVSWIVTLSDGTQLNSGEWTVAFNAGQTIQFGGTPYPATFNVPATAGGKTGTITVIIADPSAPSVPIAQANQNFSIAAAAVTPSITPAAGISF
jgi:hypothetical protein